MDILQECAVAFQTLFHGWKDSLHNDKKGETSVRKVKLLTIFVICVMLTGCNNDFAERQYDSNAKIAESGDRYAKSGSVMNAIGDSVDLTVQKFDGRQTVWSKEYSENQDVEIEFLLTITSGKVKLVHIDEDGNVSTIVECTSDSGIEQTTTYTVSMKEGRNRIKIVGYDCRDIDFSMEIKD